jgi:hypothetical protein
VQLVAVNPLTGRQYGAADARREGTVIGLPRRDEKGPGRAGAKVAEPKVHPLD